MVHSVVSRRPHHVVVILTERIGTGSISLFDHLLLGANVDGSGSSAHVEGFR